MAYLNNWKALQNTTIATGKSHFLEGMIQSARPKGAGEFVWLDGTLAPSDEVFGYRTARKGITTGYWQRVSDIDASIRWFGATGKDATMLTQGVSQADADAWYGQGFCDVTKDTCDTTAFRYAMKLMEANVFRNIVINTGNYYINRTISIPERLGSENNVHYSITGYGAVIMVASSAKANIFTIFDNQVTDMTDANTQVERRFFMRGLQFVGSGRKQTAINIEGGYGCGLDEMYFRDLAYGIHLKFALKTTTSNCLFNSCDRGISVNRGDWTGVGTSNAQSNSTTLDSHRAFACRIAYEIINASGVSARDCIAEGPANSCEYGFYIDAMGATVVKDIEIYDPHFETAFTKAAVYINSSAGMVSVIEGIFSQYDCTMVHCVGAAYSTVEIRRTVYVTGNTKFLSEGTVQWLDDNNRTLNLTQSTRWLGTMPPPARIVRNFPAGFAQ